jgi:hypothetical protein
MTLEHNDPAAQSQTKSKAIVAGIINTLTGEISDTTTNTSAKTRLFLKARDELNIQHGQNAFMVFEFNSIGMGNIDYIKRHIKSENPDSLLKKVYLLQARYKVQETEKELERLEKELSLTEETMRDCLALYENHSSAKRDIIEDALSHEVSELQSEVKSLRSRLHLRKRTLKQLDHTDQE